MAQLILFLAVVLIGAPALAFGVRSPAQVVQEFYRWAMHPSPQEIADSRFDPVRPILGKDLLLALEAQRSYERACVRLVPADVKPYMLDQSPFFLEPDKAKALESTTQRISGDVARVSALLSYENLNWTDTVLLGREGGNWVILDIKWQGGGSLTKRLAEFASNRCAA